MPHTLPAAGGDQFLIAGPVWILVTPDVERDDRVFRCAAGAFGLVTGETGRGEFLPVFTDRDLAERVRRELGLATATPVTAGSLRTFCDLLANLERSGLTRVAFDPGPRLWALPIRDFLCQIRQQGKW